MIRKLILDRYLPLLSTNKELKLSLGPDAKYFYRQKDGNEVALVLDKEDKLTEELIEKLHIYRKHVMDIQGLPGISVDGRIFIFHSSAIYDTKPVTSSDDNFQLLPYIN